MTKYWYIGICMIKCGRLDGYIGEKKSKMIDEVFMYVCVSYNTYLYVYNVGIFRT